MTMDKAQMQDMLDYYQAHKGEAFINGLCIVKLLDVVDDENFGKVILVFDDSIRGPLRLNFFDTHLTQLKNMIEDEDYTNIMYRLDTDFTQYIRNNEYETQSRD